ncbi:MAG: VWA domain-containing protein [Anaerolineae bacterium]|nr:VWA domain-containing protein [Anaerolineae bacterium]
MPMQTRRLALMLALVLLLSTLPAIAQQPDPLTITVQDTQSDAFPRVTVYATIADERGIPIEGLTAGAFTLTEDGQPVGDVTVAPSERLDRPISLVLALDVSESLGPAGVEAVRRAALALLDRLPPGARDRIALITFGNPNERSITVLRDFTDDIAKLRDIVQEDIVIGPGNAYTAFWGAAYKSLELLEADPEAAARRRRAVIILTDGRDNTTLYGAADLLPEDTQRTAEEVIAYARRLGVPIYPISFGDQTDTEALEALAVATQGVSYVSATPRAIEDAFADALAKLRAEYRIDFTSALPADDAEHALDIQVTHQAYTASAAAAFTAVAHPVAVTFNLEEGATITGSALIQPRIAAAAPIVYGSLGVNGAELQQFGGDINYTWDTRDLAPGAYTLTLAVRDAAGNTGFASVTVNVARPLTVAIMSPAARDRLAGAVEIAVTVESNAAELNVVTLFVDEQEVDTRVAPDAGALIFTWDAGAAGLGAHQVEIVARDTIGNEARDSVSVDVVEPLVVEIRSPADGLGVTGDAAITYNVEANVAPLQKLTLVFNFGPYVELELAGGEGRYIWDSDAAPLGPYTLELFAEDAAGNAASDAVTLSVTRPLAVDVAAPAEGARVAGSTPVAFDFAGRPADVAAVQFFVDDLELETVTEGFNIAEGANTFAWDANTVGLGQHRLEVRLVDTQGKEYKDTTFVNVVAPLVVEIAEPAADAALDGSVSVVYTVEANAAPLQSAALYVDGALYATAEQPGAAFTWDTTTAALGAHTLGVAAADAAGNGARALIQVNVARALGVSITAPAARAAVAGEVLVRFDLAGSPGDVAEAGFWVEGRRVARLTDLRAGENRLTWDTRDAAIGLNQLEIRITDTTGAAHTDAVIVNVIEALTVAITAPADGAAVDGAGPVDIGYAVTANAGALQSVALYVDEAEITTLEAPDAAGTLTWDAAAAWLGEHRVEVAATDGAGNEARAAITVALDRAMQLTIDAPEAGADAAGLLDVTFTFAGNPADVYTGALYVDGRSVVTLMRGVRAGRNDVAWDTGTVELGAHVLEVKVVDRMGRVVSSAPVTVNVVAPLVVAITYPGPGATLGGQVEVTYAVEARAAALYDVALRVDEVEVAAAVADETDSIPAEGALPWDTTGYALGSHTLEVIATDAGERQASAAVTVNIARPVLVAITAPASNAPVAGPVDVRFALDGLPRDVARAEFRVDDRRVSTIADLKTGDNALTWDASAVDLGVHQLEIRLTDTLGREINSTVTVKVVEPLTVAIGDVTQVGGVYTISYRAEARAADLVGVRLTVDGQAIQTVEENPEPSGALTWDSTTFALGAHTVAVFAHDTNGQQADAQTTITITRPLDVTITEPALNAPVPAAGVPVRFRLDGLPRDVARAEFRVDDRRVFTVAGLQPGDNTLIWDASAAGPGPHQLEIRLTDTLGDEISGTVTVNVVAPLAVSVADVQEADGVYTLAYRAEARAADLAQVSLAVDSAAVQTLDETPPPEGTLTWDASSAPLGEHTLAVHVVDADGRETIEETTVTVRRALGVTLDAPPANANIAGTVTVRYTLAGRAADVSRVALLVDERRAASATAGLQAGANALEWNADVAGVGAHLLELQVYDTTGALAASDSALVNVVPPLAAAVVAPVPNAQVAGVVAVQYETTINSTALLARVTLRVDGKMVAEVEQPAAQGALTWDASSAAQGAHQLEFVAADSDGNTETVTVSVEVVAPVVLEVVAPVRDEVVAGVVTVRYRAAANAGALDYVALRVDGAEVARATEGNQLAWDTTGLAPGVHEVEVRAVDINGYEDAQTLSVTVERAVVVQVRTPEAGARVAGQVEVEFTVETNAAALDRVALLVDGAEVAASDEPQATDALTWEAGSAAIGAHKLTVRATDTAGNVGEVSRTVTVAAPLTIDLTAPAPDERVTGRVAVRYSATVTGAQLQSVTLLVNGEAVEALVSPAAQGVIQWDTEVVGLGGYEIAVVAEDTAGNTRTASAKVVVVRPLSVAIVEPVEDRQVSGAVTVRYQVSAAVDEIESATLLVNKLPSETVTRPGETAFTWETSELGAGAFELAVSVRDITGAEQTSEPVTVQVIFQGNSLPLFILALLVLFVAVIVVPLTLRRRRALLVAAATGAAAEETEAAAYLISEGGPTAGARWALAQDETIVGRSHTRADIVVTGRTASRQHARISRRDDTFTYADLKPEQNPSVINGEALAGSHALQEGDVIEVGDTRLRFTRETPAS